MKKKHIIIAFITLAIGNAFISCTSKPTTTESKTDSTEIICNDGETGGYLLVGIEHTGVYNEMTSLFDSIKVIAQGEQGPSSVLVAVYYDDEAKVAATELKAFIGFIVKDSTEANAVSIKYPNLQTHKVSIKNGFYHEENFTDWNNYSTRSPIVYDALLKKLNEKHSHMTEKESAIEEYRNDKIKFILQYDLD
jgi:hypothetical protein